jgi:hypothetical protein
MKLLMLSLFVLLSIIGLQAQPFINAEGKFRLIGNSFSDISNSTSANREILEIRAKSDAFASGSDGAGINLYGDADNSNAGNIIFFTGGEAALKIYNDQTIEVFNEIEFIGNNGNGLNNNGLIQKNGSSGRDELQIYSSGDSFGSNSKGAGLHLYGNLDGEHAGNIAFLTGNTNAGTGRMIIAGGGGPSNRNTSDTRVTIGNDIWDFVDDEDDSAMLNLKDPQGRPAIFINGASASEGEIAIPTGQALNFETWDGSTFNSTFEIDGSGNVGIGTTSPASKLEVVGSILMEDAPAPTNSNGHSGIFSNNGELNAIDQSGNITVISPHHFSLTKASEEMAWSYYSKNETLGKQVNVDLMLLARMVERITGDQLIYMADINGNKISSKPIKSELELLKAENKALQERLEKLENLVLEMKDGLLKN